MATLVLNRATQTLRTNSKQMNPFRVERGERMDFMPILRELLVEELQDLLHAEMQLTKALPKMAKAAHDPSLKEGFQKHLEQTKEHVERLKQVFEALGAKAKAKPCKGMMGLIEEGQETITEGKEKEPAAADLALIAAAQKVEHYEISGYGTLRTLAEQLGEKKVAKLLAQTLSEEEQTDKLLTQASQPLIEEAMSEGSEEEEEEPVGAGASGRRRHSSR
jgi:Mn-containing catalase